MTVPRGLKRVVLLGALLVLAVLLVLGRWGAAGAAALLLVGWLGLETRQRTRFRFTNGAAAEKGLDFETDVTDVRCGGCAVFVEARGALTVLPLEGGGPYRRVFEPPPLALLPLSGGRLLLAYDDHLSLCDGHGKDLRRLAFEPPLLRQGYRLLASQDGVHAALATPWFVQIFDLDLGGLLGRVRFEDAGHYIKYAALGPSGGGLLLGGAYLLDEEDGGALEARWDWWERAGQGTWERRWGQAREGYENSQLRGVQVGGDGAVLCTELWRSGYAFELRKPDGTLLWEKPGGERPVLSPGGARVAWENGPDCLVMSGTDGRELWRWRPKEQIRLKQPHDDASCLVLEGRCLRRFSPQGTQGPEIWLKNDAAHVALGARGCLALAAGRHGALLRLDGRL